MGESNMRIKTFRASSMQEALQLVRENLGPDASVLNARQIRRGIFARRQIEVEASRDLTVPSRYAARPSTEDWLGRSLDSTDLSDSASTELPASGLQNQSATNPNAAAGSSHPDVNDLVHAAPTTNPNRVGLSPSSVPSLLSDTDKLRLPDPANNVLSELLAQGVPTELAHELLLGACGQTDHAFRDDHWLIRGQIVEAVARRLSVATPTYPGPHEQCVMAFVGPTASGKTTLLGKIAASAHFDHQMEIGIVAVDCWRNGSLDPMLQLADTISARVEAVGSVEQLATSLQRLRECDMVLIDTAGRSSAEAPSMRRLHELLQIAQPDEVHLVLEANSAPAFAKMCIDRFARLGATRLNISRMDEAIGVGQWLPCVLDGQIPVQYLSYGPAAAQDWIQPVGRHLAAILLGQKKLSPNEN